MEFCKEQYIIPLTHLYKKYALEDDRFFMKKYMKNKFDFFGLRKKNRERAEKEFLAEYGLPEISEMKCLINYLYALPQREYSKTNSDAVINYVEKSDISNFSKKEALKWLEKQKTLNCF